MPTSEHIAARQAAALERIANALERIAVGQNLPKTHFPPITGPFRVTSEDAHPRT